MATAKSARVARAETIAADTRLVELIPAEPVGFVGGQYVIVDSGLVLESGKAVKRAYSLLSEDAEQGRFEIAVKRIAGGPGSRFIHQLQPGDELRFSGPWGKLYPPVDAAGPTLILATDTGITAALGLVRSARFAPLLARTLLIWLHPPPDDFLPPAFVRDRIPAACGEVRFASAPPIGHPERIAHARAIVAEVLAHVRLAQGFIAGDGAVNYALLDDLVAAGVPATRDQVESFFNMPKRSAALAAG